MPIKINLLAEAQAAEELRRKDPLKRAIAAGSLVVVALLVWSGILYSKSLALRSEQRQLEATWKSNEKRFNELVADQQTALTLQAKVAALDRFQTNRFLWGSALNAFQQTIPPNLTDKIQVIALRGTHDYQVSEEVPAKKKGSKVIEPSRPAASVEKITISIDGRDYGNPAEQNYNRFKTQIASVPFFKSILPEEAIFLQSVSPTTKLVADQRDFVQFTLECRLPPVTRYNE